MSLLSFDKDPKSDDEINLLESSDDDQDLETKYEKILKDSMKLAKINDKKSVKLKGLKHENSTLSNELNETKRKVSQLELKCSKLTERSNDVGKNGCDDEKHLKNISKVK